MRCTLAFLLAIAGAVTVTVAQQQNGAKKNPAYSKPSGGSASLEQRTIDRHNEALSVAFAEAFPENTPAEFRPIVVQLYVRCQAGLDSCAEFLWESHLLREYRKCALTQRTICAQEIQELQAELAAIVYAGQEDFPLSPEERDVLDLLVD